MHQRTNTSTRPAAASRRVVLAVALAILALGMSAISVRRASADEAALFLVVVHVSNPEPSVSRDFLADAFLKKTTRWQSGDLLRPVDQRIDAPVRSWFSESVLRRSVVAVRRYWQQRIFSGRGVPPPELESDAAVLRYVQQSSGAIGYVSADANVSEVKVLGVR